MIETGAQNERRQVLIQNNELVLLAAQHTRDKHTITIRFKGPHGQHFCLFTAKRMAYRRERELWMLL